MNININIDKKHFYILLAVIVLGLGTIYVFAGHGDGSAYTLGIYHFLQDTVKNDALDPVDADNDGIIDDAEKAFDVECTNCVQSSEIIDAQVQNADLANNAVTSAKIADANINTADIANNAVTSAKIVDANINTADIANNAVTSAKIGTIGACSNICTDSSNLDNQPTATGRGEPTINEIKAWANEVDDDTTANAWTSSTTGCVSKTDWGGWVTGTLTCDAGYAIAAISQCWNGAQFFTCGISCCKLK